MTVKVEVDTKSAIAGLKDAAIESIKNIQSGKGTEIVDLVPESMRGSVAKHLWQDNTFRYGAEYGAIAVVMHLFHLDESDFRKE